MKVFLITLSNGFPYTRKAKSKEDAIKMMKKSHPSNFITSIIEIKK